MSQSKTVPPVEKLTEDAEITPFVEDEVAAPDNENPPKKEKKSKNEGKPTIAVINQYGKTERRRRAVDLNISEQLLPPLTRNSVATYRVLTAWNFVNDDGKPVNATIDPSTGDAPDPQNLILPGSYTFYDPWEPDPTKKWKTMVNYGRQLIGENKEGDKILNREVEPVEFVNDIKRVDCVTNYMLYLFLELHPFNASNRHRHNRNTIKPLFYRTDILTAKTDKFRAVEMDLAFEAELAVVNTKDRDRIIGLAEATGQILVHGKMTDAIKADLRMWARKNPRLFFSMHGDLTPAIKLNVLDAQGLGLIEYNQQTRTFIDMENGVDLYTHPVAEEPLESFVKYLKGNPDTYNRIKELLDYWETIPMV